MHVTTVFGSIHPESGDWYLNEPVKAMHGDEEIQLAVKHSKFSIRVISPQDEEVDGDWFRQVWLRASAALRSALDALGFYRGAALEVEFVGATYDNKGVVFEDPVRPLFVIVPEREVPAEKLSALVCHAIGNAHVRHALADVRQALQLDADCGSWLLLESIARYSYLYLDKHLGMLKATQLGGDSHDIAARAAGRPRCVVDGRRVRD